MRVSGSFGVFHFARNNSNFGSNADYSGVGIEENLRDVKKMMGMGEKENDKNMTSVDQYGLFTQDGEKSGKNSVG